MVVRKDTELRFQFHVNGGVITVCIIILAAVITGSELFPAASWRYPQKAIAKLTEPAIVIVLAIYGLLSRYFILKHVATESVTNCYGVICLLKLLKLRVYANNWMSAS